MLDQFDSRRLAALRRSWRIAPPLFEVVAAFTGVYKPPTPASQLITSADDAKMLMRATQGKIDGIGRMR